MEHPVVTVKDGSLRGAKVKSIEGVDYFSFLGIPYAEPPINELRFQDPRPCKPWTGTRDALKESDESIQLDVLANKTHGEEDCLYLNVATPSLTGTKAVLVWIHGGAFVTGSSKRDKYAPDFFMKHDVVFVSMNYRLGVFGFLNMGEPDCAGNQGLKDQQVALKWVKENISVFGGDPNNVTIFGESAGGASVHAHCLSPSSKGLFQKAIIQSGTMYCPWAYKHENKTFGLALAQEIQSNVRDAREVIEILRKVPMKELCIMQNNMYPRDYLDGVYQFGPTYDKASVEPFFSKRLDEMIDACVEIPIMMGFTSHEGIMFADPNKSSLEKMDKNFASCLKKDLYSADKAKMQKIAPEVRNFYFADRPITDQELSCLVQYKGDVLINNGVQHACDNQQRSKSPTYFYRFSFILSQMTITKTLPCAPVPGASHCDELSLLFYMERFGEDGKKKKNSKDEMVKDRMMRLWTDFAKHGNPTHQIDDLLPIKWPPISPCAKHFYEINDEVAIGVEPGKKSWDFWKKLDKKIVEESHNFIYEKN